MDSASTIVSKGFVNYNFEVPKMENQIQLNLVADGILSETFDKAIRYLMYKSQEEDSVSQSKYAAALELLRVIDTLDAIPTERTGASSPSETRKVVTFSQVEKRTYNPVTPEPNTPHPSTGLSFTFQEEPDEIEITYL